MPTATEPVLSLQRARSDAPIEHLYVHFPFCARKCPYCDFNSHAGREAEIDAYIQALEVELSAWGPRLRPRTIFVGGGTPTHCSAAQLRRYLGAIGRHADLSHLAEFTVEANPGSLSAEKVAAFLQVGVNRASVGVQSFSDAHLRRLGRIHDADEAAQAIALLREGGVPRYSLDIILALPGQTLVEQESDARRAVSLSPEHVSAYVLTFEEGTAFTRMMEAGRLPAPCQDREWEHMHAARAILEGAGLERYEISNYARPGAESQHNLAYWRDADWIGVGAGAHSHLGPWRWKNVDGPARYIQGQRSGAGALDWAEESSCRDRVLEKLLMGLRLTEGVDLDQVLAQTGVDVQREHASTIASHAEAGRVSLVGSRLRLTQAGLDVANAILLDLTRSKD